MLIIQNKSHGVYHFSLLQEVNTEKITICFHELTFYNPDNHLFSWIDFLLPW